MTDDQVRELARDVEGTRANIYALCPLRYDERATSATFARIHALAGLARCLECEVWRPIPEGDLCDECRRELGAS